MNGIELQDREFFAAIKEAADQRQRRANYCPAIRCSTSWSGNWRCDCLISRPV